MRQGADIIDVGAESTRSGFTDVDENIQIKTLSPVIEYINSQYDIPISIDTRSSRVVREFKHGNIKNALMMCLLVCMIPRCLM